MLAEPLLSQSLPDLPPAEQLDQLPTSATHGWRRVVRARGAAISALLVGGLCLARIYAFTLGGSPASLGVAVLATPPQRFWHGVSLGGWLLIEINKEKRTAKDGPDVRPSWMFDQIEAKAELDFVEGLRAQAA